MNFFGVPTFALGSRVWLKRILILLVQCDCWELRQEGQMFAALAVFAFWHRASPAGCEPLLAPAGLSALRRALIWGEK